jgi:Zn-dependent M16 (insulinase) family peptidase
MRSALPFCVLPILFLALSACSKTTVDASSEEALEDSLSAFYSTLSPEDSQALMKDIAVLNEYFQTRVYKGEPADEARQEYLEMLDGKTLKQISDQVDKVKPYQSPVQPEPKEITDQNSEVIENVSTPR